MITLVILLPLLIALTKIMGLIARSLRQPTVVGELAAGLVWGWLANNMIVGQLPFAEGVLAAAAFISQLGFLGIAVYLFLSGLEMKLGNILNESKSISILTFGSIAVPLALGALLSPLFIYGISDPKPLSPPFLYLGVAFSITAFPVLIRILKSEGVFEKPLGQVAVKVAAANDVIGWILLSIAVFGQGSVGDSFESFLSKSFLFACFFLGLILSFTGLSARQEIKKIEKFLQSWVIPLFFLSSGMKVNFYSLSWERDLIIIFLVLALATVGKIGGAFIFARGAGFTARFSLALGVLMNTRGLVELVILEIGLRAGLISQRMYSIFVIMAVTTTMMTAPLLRKLNAADLKN